MECKIYYKKQTSDKNDEILTYYIVSIKDDFYLICDFDFKGEADLFKVKNDYITVKEPIEQHYLVQKAKTNKGDKFYALKPKTDMGSDVVNDSADTYIAEKDAGILTNQETNFIDKIKKYNKKTYQKTNTSNKNKDEDDISQISSQTSTDEKKIKPFTKIAQEYKHKSKSGNLHKNQKNAQVDSNAKISFISEIIKLSNRKHINEQNRSKMFHLINEELKKESSTNSAILDEINETKELIKKFIDEQKNDSEQREKITIHEPKNTVKFLNKFSSDERLKWFTHKKEADFNYHEHIKNAKKAFNELIKDFYINELTYYKVRNFILGKKDPNYPAWKKFDNIPIDITWQSVEQWCADNPGYYPDKMPIPEEYKYPKKNKSFVLSTFDQVINEFKHDIEIRNDDNYRTLDIRLDELIEKTVQKDNNDYGFNVSFEGDFKQCNVYIDCGLFFEGLKQILEWCVLHRSKSTNVNISFESYDDYYEITILHKDSSLSFDKNSNKLNGLGGEFKKVRDLFRCTCDWDIHAKLADGKSYYIDCLNKNVNDVTHKTKIREADEINGVKHILKLYKTVDL